jgi:hypothetical protein
MSVDVLSPLLSSPPPETVAVLLPVVGVVATSVVTNIGG